MYTADKVVEVLANIGVTEPHISQWERYFGFNIPHDKAGKKYYSDAHIKTFKAIKKYLALGYKLSDIKAKIKSAQAKPQPIRETKENSSNPIKSEQIPQKQVTYSSEENLHLIMLVERLLDEKDQLLADKESLLEHTHQVEMQKQELSKASIEYADQINKNIRELERLENLLKTNVADIPPTTFKGSWNGKAKLLKVVFDSIGLDIPKERVKSFKVTESPRRLYGNMVVLVSNFNCDNEPLWERTETYRMVYLNDNELTGELDVEYFVDDACVAKAIYKICCSRKK